MSNVFTIRELINHSTANNIQSYIISIDQEKALEKVDRKFIYKIMEKLGYSKTFINFIKKIYKNTQSVIANNGFLSTPFPLSKGVIQGHHHWGGWGPIILCLQRGLAISGKIYITNNAYSLSITII